MIECRLPGDYWWVSWLRIEDGGLMVRGDSCLEWLADRALVMERMLSFMYLRREMTNYPELLLFTTH